MIGPGSSRKRTKYEFPVDGCASADLPKPPQAVIGFLPRIGPMGEHRGAVVSGITSQLAARSRTQVPRNVRC